MSGSLTYFADTDSTQANYSSDNTFELNKLTVTQTIKVKPWSAKYVKILINCKFGNWKIFESRYFDNIFIPNSVFNINDGCFAILILNLGENHFKLKTGSRLGVVTDIFYPDFCNELSGISSTENLASSNPSTKDAATQLNFNDIKLNSIKISSLQII